MLAKNKVENLKAQIRYRKVVLNKKKLILTGTFNELYKSLVVALSYDSMSPPKKKKGAYRNVTNCTD